MFVKNQEPALQTWKLYRLQLCKPGKLLWEGTLEVAGGACLVCISDLARGGHVVLQGLAFRGSNLNLVNCILVTLETSVQ